MGDNSIFSVFSNIWSSVRLKIPPQFQASWWQRLFTLDMASFKKWLLFLLPFHSCAPCISILLLLMLVSGSVLLLYAGAHKISLKCLFPEKIFIEVCCKKCQKCNTIYVITFFYWISRVCKKKIKYIHQNFKYCETIEQIHFMVVNK